MRSFEEDFEKWEPHFERYREILKRRQKRIKPQKLFLRIEKFWTWLRERQILPQTLCPEHFIEYAKALDSGALCVNVETYSKCMKASFLSYARSWTHHLYKEGIFLQDPFLEFTPSHPKKTPYQRPLTQSQVWRILQLPDLSTPWGLRNQAILEVIYGSGLRISEVTALTLESVELGERVLHLQDTKNGWDRDVPLTRAAARSLERYLREGRHKLQGPRTGSGLWLTYHRRVLQPAALTDLAIDYSATLDFSFTMHGLRHACGSHLLDGGASLRHISELLGHSSLDSTSHYTKVRVMDLQRVHKQTHPRA